MPLDPGTFEIELDGGERWRDVSAFTITSDYVTPTDAWECNVYSYSDPAGLRRRFRPLMPVRLFVGGNLRCIGRIDAIEGAGTELRVSGRDYIADLVDGNIDPTIRAQSGETLEAVLLRAFAPYGITTISDDGWAKLRNVMTGKAHNYLLGAFEPAKVEDFKPSEGQGAFEWANRIAARHGYTIQPTERRSEVCLTRPQFGQDASHEFTRTLNGGGNLAPQSKARRDYAGVPTVTVATGRGGSGGKQASGLNFTAETFGPGAFSGIWNIPEVNRITAPDGVQAFIETVYNPDSPTVFAAGSTAPKYAPRFYRDDDSRTREQLERGVRRELAEQLEKTLQYMGTLYGLSESDDAAPLTVDAMVRVRDEIDDVDEVLWVRECTISADSAQDLTTSFVAVRPESFVL